MVRGNLHRYARREFDHGPVEDSLIVERVTLAFRSTPEQEAALNTLLVEQQDPLSPNYHQWLSPEEFADRFGLSTEDIQKVVDWLGTQGFTIAETARSRRWVTFTGTAGEINAAFNANMHTYSTSDGLYYANADEPTVPAALRGVVLGFRHLNNFRLKSRIRRRRIQPEFTSNISGNHFVAPDDFATIYNVRPLYNASIDGTGQTIAIAGQTDILISDIRAFRTASGLPANDPQIMLVPGSTDPGFSDDDIEADLDVEWAGAVAKNAKIIYVNAENVFDSFQYAIGQNLAPILSISYGNCEPNWTASDISSLVQLAQQANAQGMTISTPSGDAGAADCELQGVVAARTGLTVDIPGSLPYVTSIGGTAIYDIGTTWNSTSQLFGTNSGKPQAPVWSSTNNSSNGSALSYIPEITWNDTVLFGEISAGGGGRSRQFVKPAWQSGAGVPNDNARDVPDIALAASPGINPYLTCSDGSCVNGYRDADNNLTTVGGTSVGAPAFAGIVALINQKTNARQGNVNPVLYRLAATVPSAFHDITVGGNMVPCRAGSQDCASTGYLGYAATPGYDLATGLGTLDVFKLAISWTTP